MNLTVALEADGSEPIVFRRSSAPEKGSKEKRIKRAKHASTPPLSKDLTKFVAMSSFIDPFNFRHEKDPVIFTLSNKKYVVDYLSQRVRSIKDIASVFNLPSIIPLELIDKVAIIINYIASGLEHTYIAETAVQNKKGLRFYVKQKAFSAKNFNYFRVVRWDDDNEKARIRYESISKKKVKYRFSL